MPQIIRAPRQIGAPRQAAPVVDTATTAGLSQIAQIAGDVARVRQAEIEERLRKKQASDDATAFIDAELSFTEQMSQAAQELQNEASESGDGYSRKLSVRRDAIRSKVIESVPGYVSLEGRQRIELRLKQMEAQSRMDATRWQEGQASKYAASTFEKAVNASAFQLRSDPASAGKVLGSIRENLSAISGRLSPDQQQAMREYAERSVAEATVRGFAEQGDYARARSLIEELAQALSPADQQSLELIVRREEAGAQADRMDTLSLAIMKETLRTGDLTRMHQNGELDDGEYKALLGQAQNVEEAKVREAEKALKDRQSDAASMLRAGISDGVRGRQDVELAFQKGYISTSDYGSLVSAANSAEESRKRQSDVYSALTRGVPLDPFNSDVRKAANELYAQGGSAVLPDLLNAGVFPSDAASDLKGIRLSGTPEQQGKALRGIAEIYETNPAAAQSAFSVDKDVTEALWFQDMIGAGVDENRALEIVNQQREAMLSPNSQIKALMEQGRKLSAEIDVKQARDKLPDRDFFRDRPIVGGAEAENMLTEDYRRAFEAQYVLTNGDERAARKYASEVVSATWGSSGVNNNNVMAYPPERFYPISGESLRAIFEDEVSQALGMTPRNLRLVATPETRRAVLRGQAPVYAVEYTRDDGVVEVLEQSYMFDPKSFEDSNALNQFADRAKRTARLAESMRREDIFQSEGPLALTNPAYVSQEPVARIIAERGARNASR